eukprot:Awhi_evm2s14404
MYASLKLIPPLPKPKSGASIYIIDSGIDDHIEFGQRIDRQRSRFFGNRVDSYDCRGHGTAVAGVAAGKNSGVANGATLISYAVSDCVSGSTSSQTIIEALNDIHDHLTGLQDEKVVINLSNGINAKTNSSQTLINAESALKAK